MTEDSRFSADPINIDAAFSTIKALYDREGRRYIIIQEAPSCECGYEIYTSGREKAGVSWTREELVAILRKLLFHLS